jgi:hypothetical protein
VLIGNADLQALSARAPTMASLDAGPVHLEDVEILQATFEQPYAIRYATLPAGLHPTTPPLLVLLAWKVQRSPWGPLALAQARVSCRSGVRPRGFVVGCVVDNPAAATALASEWGLPTTVGSVELVRRYDRVELVVERNGQVAARLAGLDPDPLSPADVQFSVTSTLAATPRGLRLVQVEPEYNLRRAERLRPRLDAFDPIAWDEPLLEPRYPVSATICAGDVTIPSLRYLSRPDVLAFEGTEKL